MNQIEKFFKQAVADQIKVMGSSVKLVQMPGNKKSKEFTAVLTSRDGSLSLDYGGALYSVTAHILIPTDIGITPKVSDQIISGDEEYFIASVVRSVIDKAYACDLIKIG
jgi:hypothetical protein